MSTSKLRVQRVTVLGSGVMGGQIAAHCANAGYEVWLLDMKSNDGDPNAIAKRSLESMKKMNPAPFSVSNYAERIHIGNFDDHFDQAVGSADWVCEVIIERMDIKQSMMKRIDAVRKPGSIISSNTSGLPISNIGEECSEDLKAHFLGAHFFNPPRYMKLLEIIPTPSTKPEIIEFMSDFCERILGKGVVVCKDTPNFIANRVGVFSMMSILPHAFSKRLRMEDIDVLTGTLTGYSKAATFRTADMVGLDVLAHVASNLGPKIPNDERKALFDVPKPLLGMIESKKLGNKSGEGFYKKVKTKAGKQFMVIDPETLEYEPQTPSEFDSVKAAKKQFKTSGERLKFLINQDDEAGTFLWEVHAELFLYAANRIPEIADSVEAIDRAMCWGFNWELGPFQKWDACGVQETVNRMENEGMSVPDSVKAMLASGRSSFYDTSSNTVYNLASGKVEPLTPPAKNAISVASIRTSTSPVVETKEASLLDLGDGIALFEFHSKGQTIGKTVLETLFASFKEVTAHFDGLVVSHDGADFSFGANLGEMGYLVQNQDWAGLDNAVNTFQQAALGLKYLPVPVVAAPFGRTLGGGTEMMMHCDKVVAHHELYAGLVEIGVGLLPAGGGTKEMVHRYLSQMPVDDNADPLLWLKEAFKVIGMAKVSMSAPDAQNIGYLRSTDMVVMHRDLLINQAKAEALTMAKRGYVAPVAPKITLLGQTGYSALKLMLYIMEEAGWVTPYDAVVADKIAHVMTGGNLSEPTKITEQAMLDRERAGFLDLLKDKRTLARIEHMLTTGKPLRN